MDPFIGEIRIFAGTFAPRNWAFCQGQLLQISEYQALYSLLGTTYGGDGRVTFGLPDLRGRAPIGMGRGNGLTQRFEGQMGGAEIVALNELQMPEHNHAISNTATASTGAMSVTGSGTIKCSSESGNVSDPSGSFPAATKALGGDKIYTNDATKATASMNADVVELSGSVSGDVSVTVNSNCADAGASQAHQNMQPWIATNYIIALQGIYPSRS